MRAGFRLAPATLLVLLAGCTATEPPPNALLVGTWVTPFLPSGAWTTFQVHTTATGVSGSGYEWGLASCFVDSFAVSGGAADSHAAVELTLSFSNYPSGSFAGQLIAADTLRGVISTSFEGSGTVTFLRVPTLPMGGFTRPCPRSTQVRN